MNLGPTELIVILVVVLLLFGSTRLPKLARSLGEASKEFKKGVVEKEAEDAAAAKVPADRQITMTQAELDAMLAEREAQGRREAPPTPPAPAQ